MKKTILKIALLLLASLFIYSCDDDIAISEKDYSNLSVGVFGGSISSRSQSQTGKNMWTNEFKFKVFTHGSDGAGFSNCNKNNIPIQISNAPAYDVYILWASTNDARHATIGDINSDDPSTQNGGIRACINLIKEKNSDAQILFFVSIHRFDIYHDILYPFIDAQIDLCKSLNIPYLDQSVFYTEKNYKDYYMSDEVHLNENGYRKIAPMQIDFFHTYLVLKNN